MRNTAKTLRDRTHLLAQQTGKDLTLDRSYGKYRLMERLQPEGGHWISDRLDASHMSSFLDGYAAAHQEI